MGIFAASSGSAQPVIEEQTEYYGFDANSRQQIWQQILAKSPKGATTIAGHHAVNVATTQWWLEARYQLEAGLQRCELKSVQPQLKIVIRLPHWRNKWQADKILAENWDNYLRMVANHEDIHRQYTIRMVNEFEEALLGLGSYRRCRDLKEDIEKTRLQVIGKYKAKNKWFDANEYTYQKELVWF